jgi:endonuclease/exonuclease/phosphatase family metal-dependent hydrolase
LSFYKRSAATSHGLAQSIQAFHYFAQGNTSRNVALLSRFPIIARQSHHPWPPIHTTLLDATVELKPGKHLHIGGVHLIALLFVAFELWRLLEVRAILRHLTASYATPRLLAGDFNAIAPGDPVLVKLWPRYLKLMLALQGGRVYRWAMAKLLSAGYHDCYRTLHSDEGGFTLPTGTPNSRLDYLFVKGIAEEQVKACYVVREPAYLLDEASDHYPVMAILDL